MSNLIFIEQVQEPNHKTKTINVYSKHDDSYILGQIKWWSHWRRYIFLPSNNTLFDASCLNEISGKIDELMIERNKNNDE